MQQTRAVEIGTGLFVFLGFAALLFLSTQTTNLEAFIGADYYTVTAHFDNVGGLKPRSPVSMAGVTIGRVEKITFDPDRLNAVVSMNVSSKYDRIPDDSDASILTAGLLGGQYIGLQAGGSDRYLSDGDEIMLTQSAVVLENLISKYLFSGGAQSSQGGGDVAPAATPEPAPEDAEPEEPEPEEAAPALDEPPPRAEIDAVPDETAGEAAQEDADAGIETETGEPPAEAEAQSMDDTEELEETP